MSRDHRSPVLVYLSIFVVKNPHILGESRGILPEWPCISSDFTVKKKEDLINFKNTTRAQHDL